MKELLLNYKNRECKTLVGKAIQLFIFHNLTRLIVFIFIWLLGALNCEVLDNPTILWKTAYLIGIGYIVTHTLINLIYAIFINNNNKL